MFAFELAPVIANINNSSLLQGVYPQHLKLSIVQRTSTFIHRERISKILEGFTLESLMPQVIDQLDIKQFAPPKKSTTHALVYLLHQILAALDSDHNSIRLFFADFRKGFDLVDHNIIIRELENLNVHPVLVRWITAFLTNRQQCVKIDCKWRSTPRNAPWPSFICHLG